MTTIAYVRMAATLALMAVVPTATQAQQYYSGDMPNTVTISEASYTDIMNRLAALEAALGEDVKKDDGWKDMSQEKWTVKWGGRLMMDYVTWANQDSGYGPGPAQNYIELRRARFRAEGEGYGVYYWQVEVDFAADDDSSTFYNAGPPGLISVGPHVEMKDMYFGMLEVPVVHDVVVGHFKAPFSLEEMTSSRHITFIERALPNFFAPSRDIGIAAFNHTKGENLAWAFGVFADGVPESTKQLVDNNIGTQLVGRVTCTPYYDEPSGGRYLVHLGAGIRYVQDGDGRYSLRVRPETHEGIRVLDMDADNDYANQYTVYNGELAWVYGPFSIQTEGFINAVDVADVGAQTPGIANAYGAYAQISYFLTGEHRVYKRTHGTFDRVKPLTNFWLVPGCVGWGAWELKGRWSYIDVSQLYEAGFTGDSGENAEQVNNLALGLNWYWNPYSRMMFDYWHSWSKRQGLAADNADLFGMRFQFDW